MNYITKLISNNYFKKILWYWLFKLNGKRVNNKNWINLKSTRKNKMIITKNKESKKRWKYGVSAILLRVQTCKQNKAEPNETN